MTRRELAAAIYRTAHLTGTFQLRSGATSSEYFDKYRFESDPRLLAAISTALAGLVPPGVQALGGLELGGVPLATQLSQVTGLPTLFVRKAAKQYGTCQLAEGGVISGRHILLVEDVVTSGGQVVESAGALRELGAVVSDALCVIDREAGGPEALAAIGVRLHPLFRMSELKGAAV
ncbi:MAG: orotate phosphoribosyltransferase [Vicinamibacterales bacterium]